MKFGLLALFFICCGINASIIDDFINDDLIDSANSTSQWSNAQQSILQSFHQSIRGGDFSEQNIGSSVENTNAIIAADFNGDGFLDVAIGLRSNLTKVYLNNTSSTPFSGVAAIELGSAIADTDELKAIDIDNDGDLDLIEGNWSRSVIFLNNGTSVPFSSTDISVAINPGFHATRDIEIADFNGDGYMDVLLVNTSETDVIYFHNGDNSLFNSATSIAFADATDISTTGFVADINNDGYPDYVACSSNQVKKLYLHNQSITAFDGVLGLTIGNEVEDCNDIIAGDLNSDGWLDVVFAGRDENRYYLNTLSPPYFTAAAGTAISSDNEVTNAIILVDVDTDGHLDIAVSDPSRINKFYINSGTAVPFNNASANSLTMVETTSNALFSADFNDDGLPDFVIASDDSASLLLLNKQNLNPLTGNTTEFILTNSNLSSSGVAIGDVNQDGFLDIVVGIDGGINQLYINNGTSDAFSGVTPINIGTDSDLTTDIAIADIDKDGDLDVIAGNWGTSKYYLNNDTADPFNGVTTGIDINPSFIRLERIEVIDVNKDGDLDVLFATDDGQTSWYMLNNGTATPFNAVAMQAIGAELSAAEGIAVADINNDTFPDVILAIDGALNQYYLHNTTASPYSGVVPVAIGSTTNNTIGVVLTDLNLDGNPDLVFANSGQAHLYYINNTTATPFSGAPPVGFGDELDATDISAVDIDNDGDFDLVLSSWGNLARVFLNRGSNEFITENSQGVIIGRDKNTTDGLAVADLNGDGKIDLVQANTSSDNIISYGFLSSGSNSHYAGMSKVQSLTMDTDPADILNTHFIALQNSPTNSSSQYWVTNNGGIRWYSVSPNQEFVFPTTGSDLRWKSDMMSLSPLSSFEIQRVEFQAVNFAPAVQSTPSLNKTFGDSQFTINFHDVFSDDSDTDQQLTYTLSNNSDTNVATGSAINSVDGLLTVTIHKVGSSLFTVKATDTGGKSTDVIATVTISQTNLTISADNQSMVYLQSLPALLASYAGFVNGDGPTALTGSLNLSTTANANSVPGIYTISISGLTSSNYNITYQQGSLTVFNNAPIITGTAPTNIQENSLYNFLPTANDDTGQSLSFSIINKPSWASFSTSTGSLTSTPNNADVGLYTDIVICVSDTLVSTCLASFSINVANINDAPSISGSPPVSVNERQLFSFTPEANDIDENSQLTFTADNLPAWLILKNDNGSISGIPDSVDIGLFEEIKLCVSDGMLQTCLPKFSITVENVNDAPSISGSPPVSVNERQLYSFIVEANDIDENSQLTFTADNLPGWLILENDNGSISGIPDNIDVGLFEEIKLCVSDGMLQTCLAEFSINVENINDAPEIFSLPITQGMIEENYSYQVDAADKDNDSLTFTLKTGPQWLSFIDNNLHGFIPRGASAEEFIIEIEVSDGELIAEQLFNLAISTANTDVALSWQGRRWLIQNQSESIQLTADNLSDKQTYIDQLRVRLNGDITVNAFSESCTLVSAIEWQCLIGESLAPQQSITLPFELQSNSLQAQWHIEAWLETDLNDENEQNNYAKLAGIVTEHPGMISGQKIAMELEDTLLRFDINDDGIDEMIKLSGGALWRLALADDGYLTDWLEFSPNIKNIEQAVFDKNADKLVLLTQTNTLSKYDVTDNSLVLAASMPLLDSKIKLVSSSANEYLSIENQILAINWSQQRLEQVLTLVPDILAFELILTDEQTQGFIIQTTQDLRFSLWNNQSELYEQIKIKEQAITGFDMTQPCVFWDGSGVYSFDCLPLLNFTDINQDRNKVLRSPDAPLYLTESIKQQNQLADFPLTLISHLQINQVALFDETDLHTLVAMDEGVLLVEESTEENQITWTLKEGLASGNAVLQVGYIDLDLDGDLDVYAWTDTELLLWYLSDQGSEQILGPQEISLGVELKPLVYSRNLSQVQVPIKFSNESSYAPEQVIALITYSQGALLTGFPDYCHQISVGELNCELSEFSGHSTQLILLEFARLLSRQQFSMQVDIEMNYSSNLNINDFKDYHIAAVNIIHRHSGSLSAWLTLSLFLVGLLRIRRTVHKR
ncbi:MAG: FG-GAP-like repeat-containing protein [Colwellia sp.]|nr:FG-GAP-like repeat-containing protein [Colwellia sp.]